MSKRFAQCEIKSGLGINVKSLPESEKATLEHEIFFSFDFDFVKGNKLPGKSFFFQ